MLHQIILKTFLAVLVIYNATNPASAQIKHSQNSGQVSIDWSVLDEYRFKSLFNGVETKTNLSIDLLEPPSKMPRSRFYDNFSNLKPDKKLSRLKNNKTKAYTKGRLIRAIKPKKATEQSVKRRLIKKLKPKTKKHIKKEAKTPIATSKQNVKVPTKLSTTSNSEKMETAMAPAPKAAPKASVKILSAPPPEPPVRSTPLEPNPILPKIATRSENIISGKKLIIFKQGDAKLSLAAKSTLDNISDTLKNKPNIRMQLQAYAGEPNLSASRARRLSLSRALSARSYLIKKGIRSTRIDVRAFGNKTSDGEPNRVELKLIKN